MLFISPFTRSSKKNGTITVFRFFGSPKVIVQKFEQAGDYLIGVWRDALTRILLNQRIEHILILGLGGGCSVKTIYKQFPNAHLTFIEWDEEMIHLAQELHAFPKNCSYEIIYGDACEEIKKLDRAFDLILVDLFTGGVTEPRLASDEIIGSIAQVLSPDGVLLLNAFKTLSLIPAFEKQLTHIETWTHRYNTLASFRRIETRPNLLFITNPKNSDPEEDHYLSHWLRSTFNVTVVDPKEAVRQLASFKHCLIRNAWPSRLFENEFKQLKKIVVENGITCYNPFHRAGFIEDKAYLIDLCRAGYPVIPSVDSIAELDQLPHTDTYLIKPKNGCSSFGIKTVSRKRLERMTLNHHLIQPVVDFTNECSFYFIDGTFAYALASAHRRARWNLHAFEPTSQEIAWAKQFIDWNHLPYGLERVDACRLRDGSLLLMELESEMPMLSLSALNEETGECILQKLLTSLKRTFDVTSYE